jgi:putative ABC transport system permease protein
MRRVFAERRKRASGPLGILALWLEAAFDVVPNALRIHYDLLRQDVSYMLRAHARAPGLALTAVLVTALGIGANTAVFSVTDQVLLRPLPFPDSGRLVKLWQREERYSRMELSPPNYRDWKEMSSSFEAMAAFFGMSFNLVGHGEPVAVEAGVVDPELFPVLGIQPILGRVLVPEEGREGAPGAAVLSYGLWQARFGGSMDALGASVRLDDRVHTIVGVMPRDFHYPDRSTELWIPTQFRSEDFEDRNNNYLEVVAKLRPGVSIDAARAEMDRIAEELERAYPKENENTRASVLFLRDEISVQARLLLAALFGASVCVLLIACTNLAHLLIARGMERRKELSVRTALGAGRERLLRQLLTESMLLAGLGGLLGLGLASLLLPFLARLAPASLPLSQETTIDPRVLGFTALITVLTGVGFGALPALRSAGGFRMEGLREGSRGGIGGHRQKLRSALVVTEVAASVILLVTASLLIRALWRVQEIDPGFRRMEVIALRTPLPIPKYENTSRRAELYTRVLFEARALPGVESAAYTSFLPMVMRGGIWPVSIPGLPVEVKRTDEVASLRFVSPEFFATLGIPLRLGRDVSDSDTTDSPAVAVVSESFVRRYWPGQDPLGRRFDFGFAERTIVGVVADIRVRGLERESEPQVYLPYRQVPDGRLVYYAPRELVVRLADPANDHASILAALRRIVREADPDLPLSEARTLEEVVGEETAPRITQIRILGAFAGLSLLLAGIGIYGLLSFAVSQRRTEIGLRIAFGARSSDILRMVLREGALLALIGAILGVALGYVAGGAMEALLAGLAPEDATTYAFAAAGALLMALLGSLFPALRAIRVDPNQTLRAE